MSPGRTPAPIACDTRRPSPRILAARRVISEAARRVKVRSRMRCGSAPLRTRCATRWARVFVLPVPAPAMIRSGGDGRPPRMPNSTAALWLSFRSISYVPWLGMNSALRRSLTRIMKTRWGRGPAVLFKVIAGRLDIMRKDLGHLLVQMRAHDNPQTVDLLGVRRHRIGRQNPSSLPYFVRDVKFIITLHGLI